MTNQHVYSSEHKLNELEKRVVSIETRNKRVEKEKAWESSTVRKIAIAVITYLFLASYFGIVLNEDPWKNAIVPTVGFLLSTLSLSLVRKVWERKRE